MLWRVITWKKNCAVGSTKSNNLWDICAFAEKSIFEFFLFHECPSDYGGQKNLDISFRNPNWPRWLKGLA